MLKVILFEEDYLTSEIILNTIESTYFDVKVNGVASDIQSVLQLINKDSPDLVIFDIDIFGKKSFDLLKKLDTYNFRIIFITADDKYALQAIKFNPIDYLLKPINVDELILAIEKVKFIIKNEKKEIQSNSLGKNIYHIRKESEKIVLKTQESIHLINIKEIIRCESGGSYTYFYINNGKKITTSKLLKEYDEQLQNQGFIRVHQSHLVNINYIDSFDKKNGGMLLMKEGSKVPISFRKKESFLKLIEEF